MTGAVSRLRRWYGAPLRHLLALVASFALAGYAVHAVAAAGQWRGFAIWFGAAIVAHDLLLFPVYSVADRVLRQFLRRRAGSGRSLRPPGPGPGRRARRRPLPPCSTTCGCQRRSRCCCSSCGSR